MLGARRNRAEQGTLGHHSTNYPGSREKRRVPMKHKCYTSGSSGLPLAALVQLGWISFVIGQAVHCLPIAVKLILLVVARVLPRALRH